MKTRTSFDQPVNARAASRTSRSRVVAHAHREQLEQLAAEVLVRVLLDVLAVVQIHEHRRVFQNPDEQVAKVSRRPRAEHLVLPEHHPVVAHLVFAGREVTVPEQRQLFLERTPASSSMRFAHQSPRRCVSIPFAMRL